MSAPGPDLRENRARRSLDPVRALLLVLAAVMYFLPWHTVGPTEVDPLAFTCTGFTHFRRTLAIPALVACSGLLLALWPPKRGGAPDVPRAVARFALVASLVFLSLQEKLAAHTYVHIADERWPARIFYGALGTMLALELVALGLAVVSTLRRASSDDGHESP
jgi:hypothetical protein